MKRVRWVWLVGLVVSLWVPGPVWGQVAMTHVSDTVYGADGAAARGTVLISWPGFTTAAGQTVARGSTSVTLTTAGLLSVNLAPNAGAMPVGTYYSVVYHLQDGSVSREYWVLPVASGAVSIASVRASVLPVATALQTVTKSYVDSTVAGAVAGVSATAASKSYVDTSVANAVMTAEAWSANAAHITGGTLPVAATAALTGDVVKAAGANATTLATVNGAVGTYGSATSVPVVTVNGKGLVTGVSTAALGTMAGQNANAVSITGGTAALGQMNVSTAAAGGGQLVSVLAPNMTSGNAVAMGFGKALTAGNSLFLAYWTKANSYGSIETYAYSVPVQVGGSQVWLNGGPVFVGNANANADGGAALPSGGLFNVGTTNQFQVGAGGDVSALSVALKVNAVAYSSAVALSSAAGHNRVVLSGNVASSTIGAGADGQRMCVDVVQDGTGGRTFVWPANVLGGMSVGTAAGKRSLQCFVYFSADGAWLADGAGLVM